MNSPSLLSLPPDRLRDIVLDRLRRHWIRPLSGHSPGSLRQESVEKLSRAVLDTMLTRQFRVGPLPPPRVYAELLERVRRCVCRGRPVAITVGYGPLKNQNAISYSRADWAEFFSLCHLVAWHNKVQAAYSPGLMIDIVFDDTTLAMANDADKHLMRFYQSSIVKLIQVLKYERILRATMRHSHFAWLFHFGLYQLARWQVWRWECDPANQVQLERMNHFARRNLFLPDHLTAVEQEKRVRRASHRYRVYWQALQSSGLTRGKSRLIAMYLDGSQHHIRQDVAFHLTSLDKGNVTQPWQGAGVLEDNGHGALTPLVLTAERRRRSTTRLVENLNLINCPGFDSILVAEPRHHGLAEGSQAGPAPASVSCGTLA